MSAQRARHRAWNIRKIDVGVFLRGEDRDVFAFAVG
jgi:hypothetical protein